MKIVFQNVFVHCDLFDSDFQMWKRNLCKIIITSPTVFAPLSHSLFSRKSVDQHRKHIYVSFNDVLPKDFESYPLADLHWWLLNNTGMIFESSKSKNHLHSYAVGVQMIFLCFNLYWHSRQIENSNFIDFNGLLIVIFTSKTVNIVRIRLKTYSVTCLYIYSVCDHHIWSWWDPICT